jgi:hypothetical protein
MAQMLFQVRTMKNGSVDEVHRYGLDLERVYAPVGPVLSSDQDVSCKNLNGRDLA